MSRSDELPRGHPVRRLRNELRRAGELRQVAVEPLDAGATAALLDQTLGAAAPSLRRAVFDRTDGIPFYVKELAAALADGGRLHPGPAGLELLAGADVPLPDGVRDAVLLRAAGLTEEALKEVTAERSAQLFLIQHDRGLNCCYVRVSGRGQAHKGETLYVTTDPKDVHVFDTESGERLSD